jgi:lipopolysaccharide biosynthesis glycosyltransferase
MDPVVIALASDNRYFSGLYCAVASALLHLNPARRLDVHVLDGGLSQSSRDTLLGFINRVRQHVVVNFITADCSAFRGTPVGPGKSHMAYCRILLPLLLDVPRLIYLDCDTLVFRDLSKLFDFALSPQNVIAAVPDSETLSLGDDSLLLARAMKVPPEDHYFNSGVMLMNLEELRREHFVESAVEFLNRWSGKYRFHDQSAINFLLHEHIEELPEHWNRASWRFDTQLNNDLNCVLHYTSSAPWICGRPTPAQVLFERFASEVGLPVNCQRTCFQEFRRGAAASLRALAFPVASLCYRLSGNKDKAADYHKFARYWLDYVCSTPARRRLYRQRRDEIGRIQFNSSALLMS